MTRVYELPTHLQVEDQLIAGLTVRQLLRLMIGGRKMSTFLRQVGGTITVRARPPQVC